MTPSHLLFSLDELKDEIRNHVEVEVDVVCAMEFISMKKIN